MTDRMTYNGRELLIAKCDACGVVENLDLLDYELLDTDEHEPGHARESDIEVGRLLCIRCYGEDYCPPRSRDDFRFSVAQSLTDHYERWQPAT